VARPSKVRYFKGKAPDAAPDSDSDSDEDEVRHAPEPVKVDTSLVAGGAGRIITDASALASKKGVGEVKVALRDVKIEGGRVVLPKSAKEGA
jgi:microfibrillar-associated protein 1